MAVSFSKSAPRIKTERLGQVITERFQVGGNGAELKHVFIVDNNGAIYQDLHVAPDDQVVLEVQYTN